MSWSTFSARKLMEESEARLSRAITDGSESQRLAAARIVNDPLTYRIWEAQHERLMQRVAGERSSRGQLRSLRAVTMSLIHRKAVFEFMRRTRLNRAERRALMLYLYGPTDYANAVVSEHGHFLRASASHFCTTELGTALLLDAVFHHWLVEYERAYDEYFAAHARTVLQGVSGKLAIDATYLPLLKQMVTLHRRRILALPRIPQRSPDGFELREPTGDTVTLPAFRRSGRGGPGAAIRAS